MPGSQLQLADPVRRAAVVTHGRPEVIGNAVALLEAYAADAGVEIVDEEAAQPDLVIVLGGDGTMLRALQRYLGTGIPVLGINFGRVGFLTSIEGVDIEAGLFARICRGVHGARARHARRRGGQRTGRVSERRRGDKRDARPYGGARLADRRREPWLRRVRRCICSTPTGSTAYNLSNGGPVLVWGLDAMAVTFVAPHSLHARSLVVPRSRDVVVRNRTLDVGVTVLVDGHELAVPRDRRLHVRAARRSPCAAGRSAGGDVRQPLPRDLCFVGSASRTSF